MKNLQYKEIKIAHTLIKLSKYFSKKRKFQLILIFLLMIISGLAEVFVLSSVIPFINLITNPDSISTSLLNINNFKNIAIIEEINISWFITALFIFAVIFSSLIRIFNLWVGGRYAASLGTDLSVMCYRRVINQPYEFHINKNSSEYISLIAKEITSTTSLLQKILNMFASLIILIFLSAFLLLKNWELFIFLTIAFTSIYVLIIFKSKNFLFSNSKWITHLNANQIKILQESVGSIRDIILNRLSSYYSKVFTLNEYKLHIKNTQNKFIDLFPRYAIEGLSLTIISLTAVFIANNKGNAVEVISLLGLIAIGVQRLLPNFQLIYSTWTNIQSNKVALAKVLDYLSKYSYKNYDFFDNKLDFKRSIELKNIYFKYNKLSKKYIIRRVNLLINKGDRIGLVGESGAGKTTLLDLINGLLEPTKGSIFIDDYDLHSKSNRKFIFRYRQLISYVPQNIFLTDSTIAENIAFGIDKKHIDLKRIRKVAKIVQLDDFIMSRPEKYNLFVGEKGIKLSGGQLQRIGLARALYKNSEIIFLDEATSALDNKTEKKIVESIKLLDKNITIIMIAHRMSSLEFCNKIFEIKNGKVFRNYEGDNSNLIN